MSLDSPWKFTIKNVWNHINFIAILAVIFLFPLYQVLTSVCPDIYWLLTFFCTKIVNKTFLNQFLDSCLFVVVVCTQFFFLQLQTLPFTNLSVSSAKSLHSSQNTILKNIFWTENWSRFLAFKTRNLARSNLARDRVPRRPAYCIQC